MKGKHKGNNQWTSMNNDSHASSGLSQQDLEYLTAHENEIKRNQQMADIIQSLTNN